MGMTIDQELAEISDLALRIKANYLARLKAEKIAVLEELKTEIEDVVKEEELIDKKWSNGLHYSEKLIQQKINALKKVSCID